VNPPPRNTDGNLLRRLARVNPTTAFLVALAVLLAGFVAPGIIGGALLCGLAALLVALTFTTWPVQTPSTRVARLVLLSLLIGIAVVKVV
jgi:multisubunit Na+/H+ antiporter MnhB subunit